MSNHTGASYDNIAAAYAERQNLKPWTIYYERPAVLGLLPQVQGKTVLDAGCGPGFFAAHLVDQGATVTAIDFNADFVAMTRQRTGNRALVRQADLAEPLAFAETASFDFILCVLVLHYLHDWLPTLKEFHRVLKPSGTLLFSTHHPFTDMDISPTGDYFAVDLLEDEWDVGKVRYYRRPLSKICHDVRAAGFVIDDIHEPQPIQPPEGVEFRSYQRAMTSPQRLFVQASKRRD